MKKMYRTEITRSGDVMDYFSKYSDARAEIRMFEKEDRAAGVFIPGFYTISRWNGTGYVPIYVSYHNESRHKSKKKSKRSGNDYGIKGDWRPFEGM